MRPLWLLRWSAVVLLCSGVAAAAHDAAPADAQRPSADPAPSALLQARRAFQAGIDFANSGQWSEAVAQFERSWRLRPHPATSYNIAYSERALGRSSRALKLFRRALAEHAARSNGTLSEEHERSASAYAFEAERKLARVRIRVHRRDARLLVDGRPLERVRLDQTEVLVSGTRAPGPPEPVPAREFEVWTDPGLRLFSLRGPGSPELLLARELTSGTNALLELRAPPGNLASRPRTRSAPAPGSRAPQGVPREWAWLAFGIGSSGLVAGSLAGVYALRERQELKDACGSAAQCTESRQGQIASFGRAADVSTGGFAVAIAGAVAGAVLLTVFAEKPAARPERAPPRSRAAPATRVQHSARSAVPEGSLE